MYFGRGGAAEFEYLQLEVRRILAGETFEGSTDANELAVVGLGGRFDLELTKGTWRDIGVRANVLTGMPWVETGYTGTELGDWGYMPTDPQALSRELTRRGIVMLGAFVPVVLKDACSHDSGRETAVKTARLLAAVAPEPAPFLVLADNNGSVPQRTLNAGRINSQMGLADAEWKTVAKDANSIARAVRDESGLETVFHHHCGGYVETPDEIECFLELTDPQTIGLVFDTGHYLFGAGDCEVAAGLNRFQGRIRYLHLKDCSEELALKSRTVGLFPVLAPGDFL
jgi:inosose dehydratase